MKVVADQSWCLTNKGERVPEGHPLARFLLVGKGCEIEESELEAYPVLEEAEQVKWDADERDAGELDEDETGEETAEGEPVKRPRGRPRKSPISE